MQEYILETGVGVDAVSCKESVRDNALLLFFHLVNFLSAADWPWL